MVILLSDLIVNKIVKKFGLECLLLKLPQTLQEMKLLKMILTLKELKIWDVVTLSKEEDAKMDLIPLIVFMKMFHPKELINVQELIN